MIPIIHARIHQRLIKHSQGNIVTYAFIKEWIARVVMTRSGIKKSDIPLTIDDMVEMGLLKKICRLKYQIMPNKDRNLREDII